MTAVDVGCRKWFLLTAHHLSRQNCHHVLGWQRGYEAVSPLPCPVPSIQPHVLGMGCLSAPLCAIPAGGMLHPAPQGLDTRHSPASRQGAGGDVHPPVGPGGSLGARQGGEGTALEMSSLAWRMPSVSPSKPTLVAPRTGVLWVLPWPWGFGAGPSVPHPSWVKLLFGSVVVRLCQTPPSLEDASREFWGT